MRGLSHICIGDFGRAARGLALGALIAAGGVAVLGVPTPAQANGSYSPYDESASAALARYVRAITDNPQDFEALIGAGRAAIARGTTCS